MMHEKTVSTILADIQNKSIAEQLHYLSDYFKGSIAFSTSFGVEDQVITDILFRNDIPIRVFTLDTGRHFEATYRVMEQTNEKYGKKIEVYFPDTTDVEKLMQAKGPFSFYQTVENRVECCNIRKVQPLKRALSGIDCWITGLRAEQSDSRKQLNLVEWDPNYQLLKFNPLIDWTSSMVTKYISDNNVPYNALHDKGFVSIGCEPCTRAVKPGEHFRAGRWWWEDNTKKECGLHERNHTKE